MLGFVSWNIVDTVNHTVKDFPNAASAFAFQLQWERCGCSNRLFFSCWCCTTDAAPELAIGAVISLPQLARPGEADTVSHEMGTIAWKKMYPKLKF